MTMFSMKPKFNLAEFLAVPATPGVAKSAAARRRMPTVAPAAPAAAVEDPGASAPAAAPAKQKR